MAVRRVRVKITRHSEDEMDFHFWDYETSTSRTGFFNTNRGAGGLKVGDVVTLVTDAEGLHPVRIIKDRKPVPAVIMLWGPAGYKRTTIVP